MHLHLAFCTSRLLNSLSHRVSLALTLGCMLFFGHCLPAQTFYNPIGYYSDPYIYQDSGNYYLLATATGYDGREIVIRSSTSLSTLGAQSGTTVWTDPNLIESPELYRGGNLWYIYYTSFPDDTGKVLESDSSDPLGSYHQSNGNLCQECYDLSLFYTNNQLYLMYSHANAITVRTMSDNNTTSGPESAIIVHDQAWEGDCCVEAPNIAYDPATGRFSIVYAGNYFASGNYANNVAYLTYGADPTDPASWTKLQGPVFGGSDDSVSVYGAGTFAAFWSPDYTQQYFVYNAFPSADYSNPGNRQARVQPLYFDSDGIPQLGAIYGNGDEQVPSGDPGP